MLEGLDQIDWHSLTHAYGPADDVPELVRNLASNDKTARGNALYALYGNIWHQGTIYEATSHAVPFLIELLKASDVQGKDQILFLLAQLHGRLMYTDIAGRFAVVGSQAQEPEFPTIGRSNPNHLKPREVQFIEGLIFISGCSMSLIHGIECTPFVCWLALKNKHQTSYRR